MNHTILLDKLHYYGFRGIVNQWFSSYLSNRTQTTEIDSHICSKLNINCGVPQGSILGPLLFLLYINGIQCCSSKLQFVLFDDDTNAVYAHKDLKTLKLTVNTDLHNLSNWLTSNKLSLNIKKSNYVIFGPHQKKLNFDPQVNVFDNESNKKVTLERKNFIKFLGLLIDENLSWKTHIHSVADKISKTIGLIARLRHIVPACTLLNIYQSLITPLLGQRV